MWHYLCLFLLKAVFKIVVGKGISKTTNDQIINALVGKRVRVFAQS